MEMKQQDKKFIFLSYCLPTAKFDPRHAVQTFVTLKDRRMNLPNIDSYRES